MKFKTIYAYLAGMHATYLNSKSCKDTLLKNYHFCSNVVWLDQDFQEACKHFKSIGHGLCAFF